MRNFSWHQPRNHGGSWKTRLGFLIGHADRERPRAPRPSLLICVVPFHEHNFETTISAGRSPCLRAFLLAPRVLSAPTRKPPRVSPRPARGGWAYSLLSSSVPVALLSLPGSSGSAGAVRAAWRAGREARDRGNGQSISLAGGNAGGWVGPQPLLPSLHQLLSLLVSAHP